jgi:hypothetical protein
MTSHVRAASQLISAALKELLPDTPTTSTGSSTSSTFVSGPERLDKQQVYAFLNALATNPLLAQYADSIQKQNEAKKSIARKNRKSKSVKDKRSWRWVSQENYETNGARKRNKRKPLNHNPVGLPVPQQQLQQQIQQLQPQPGVPSVAISSQVATVQQPLHCMPASPSHPTYTTYQMMPQPTYMVASSPPPLRGYNVSPSSSPTYTTYQMMPQPTTAYGHTVGQVVSSPSSSFSNESDYSSAVSSPISSTPSSPYQQQISFNNVPQQQQQQQQPKVASSVDDIASLLFSEVAPPNSICPSSTHPRPLAALPPPLQQYPPYQPQQQASIAVVEPTPKACGTIADNLENFFDELVGWNNEELDGYVI